MNITVDFEQREGHGYYHGLRFKLYGTNQTGQEFDLSDGGFTDWTQKLLSNRKERFLISGFGSELICKAFAPQPPGNSGRA